MILAKPLREESSRVSIPMSLGWEELLGDAGVPAVVSDPFAGRILWANEPFAAIYAKGRRASELAGRRLAELTSEEAAMERHSISRDVIRTGKPRVIRDLWNGRALCVTIRPLAPFDQAPNGAVLAVFRPALAGPPGLADPCEGVHQLRNIDLGPLANLSKRELEVLAHIGEGLTNAEIASRLHRTAKTIEAHRTSLAAKLGVGTRVELAAVAARAGLGPHTLPHAVQRANPISPDKIERAASN